MFCWRERGKFYQRSQTFNFALIFIFWNNYRVIRGCKDRTERCCVLFAQLPQMVTSYVTVIKCQNQQIHSGTMCVYFFVILSHVYIYVTTTTIRIQNYSVNVYMSLMQPFSSHCTPTILNLEAQFVLYIYTFFISSMLYKWYHTVCNLLRLAFFHSAQCPWDLSMLWHVSIDFLFFFLSIIPWYVYIIMVCLTVYIYLLLGILVVAICFWP